MMCVCVKKRKYSKKEETKSKRWAAGMGLKVYTTNIRTVIRGISKSRIRTYSEPIRILLLKDWM